MSLHGSNCLAPGSTASSSTEGHHLCSEFNSSMLALQWVEEKNMKFREPKAPTVEARQFDCIL